MHHESTVDGSLSRDFVVKSHVNGRIGCKHCGSDRLFRVFRQGYLQEKIYPLFGFYPWKCRSCKGYMLLHKRKRLTPKPERAR